MLPNDLRRSPVALMVTALLLMLFGQRAARAQPPGQPGADAACAAACQSDYDRSVAQAASNLKARRYYVGTGSAECPTPWDSKLNACSSAFLACDGKCGVYETGCKRPCADALELCCHANALTNAGHDRESCLKACPGAKAPSGPARMTEAPDDAKARSVVPATPAPENDSDNARRRRAFDQVQDQLEAVKGSFAVVSGGAGRLWIVRSDGTRVQADPYLAKLLRATDEGSDKTIPADRQDQAHARLIMMGFSRDEAISIVDSLSLSQLQKPLAPGEVLYFPAGGGWAKSVTETYSASSEHSSIRGSINGGGDFI